jgi:hypothetical protein
MKEIRQMRKVHRTVDFVRPRSLCDGALLATRRALADCEVRGWIADDLNVPYSLVCREVSAGKLNDALLEKWAKKWEMNKPTLAKIIALDPDSPSLLHTRRNLVSDQNQVLKNLMICASLVHKFLNRPIDEQKQEVRKWSGLSVDYCVLAPSLYHCSEIIIDAMLDEAQCECRIDEKDLFTVATWGGWQLRAELDYWLSNVATVYRGLSLGHYKEDNLIEYTEVSMKPSSIDRLEKDKLEKIQKVHI